jgi:serine/threonine protein kinase
MLGRLGAGGIGEVLLARDPRLDRRIAIKVLPRAAAADPERLRRFVREAHALTALVSPAGMSVDRLLAVAIPIAAALGAERAHGITHRDLKPGNVMVTADGCVNTFNRRTGSRRRPSGVRSQCTRVRSRHAECPPSAGTIAIGRGPGWTGATMRGLHHVV